jgi:hypothetical protein
MFRLGAPLQLAVFGNLALGAQQAKVDANIRTSSSLGTPSIQFTYAYYPLALRIDGGRLAPMAIELVDHSAL